MTTTTTKLHPGAPHCVRDTYAIFLSEIDRKDGMIEDLNAIAVQNFGLSNTDCRLLEESVKDRDNLRAAVKAIGKLYGES